MKPVKHLKDLLLSLTFCMVLAGCSSSGISGDHASAEADRAMDSEASASGMSDERQNVGTDKTDKIQSADTGKTDEIQSADTGKTDASSGSRTATLYIGTRSEGFAEYPFSYEGTLTPELLIQGIADLTGWDLTLAEPVATGKGGMSVCLSESSALFTGPPEPQKDEFHMFGAEQLAQTILDSIQKTLQMGFTGELGNPDALDIYYYMAGEQPLSLPDIGMSWPLDQPYQW